MGAIKVAQVGCGYWGQNLLRNLWDAEEVDLVAACDLSALALERACARYPGLQTTHRYADIVLDPAVDAVVLATPASTHYEFARQALAAGKHVLVEKPMATSVAEALDLLELADRQRRVLMVDHTFLFTGAVRRMKESVDTGELGELLYYDSVRINLGIIQDDTNVLWDLGPHDFSIMDYLCAADPVAVAATGVRHLPYPHENIAYVTVRFDSSLIAHFHLNWLAPVKVRMTLVGGSLKMIVYNDMEPSEKVKIYDRGVTVTLDPEKRVRLLADYREGDLVAPHLDNTEALRLVVQEFAGSILEERRPVSDGVAGYRVVRLLEAAQRSMEQGGREVPLSGPALPRPEPVDGKAAGDAPRR